MAPALPLEAPTNSKSLLGVEETVQRKPEACLYSCSSVKSIQQQRHPSVSVRCINGFVIVNHLQMHVLHVTFEDALRYIYSHRISI